MCPDRIESVSQLDDLLSEPSEAAIAAMRDLPGDIVVRRGSFTFYFPIVTCVVLSLLATIILSFLRRS